jgi:streptogramin lyase
MHSFWPWWLLLAGSLCIGICEASAEVHTIVTFAGTGSGGFSGDTHAATSAQFRKPSQLALDTENNLFICDTDNGVVRMVLKTTGVITTYAGTFYVVGVSFSGDGGAATSAHLSGPSGVAVDSLGNVYISDTNNNRIRVVTKATKVITTYAGTGTNGLSGDGAAATLATFSSPYQLAFDKDNNLYICDNGNDRIRLVTKSTGVVSTFASNAYHTKGVAVNMISGTVYYTVQLISQHDDDRLNYVADYVQRGGAGVLAGMNTGSGRPTEAPYAQSTTLGYAQGLAVDPSGNVYIADGSNNAVYLVTASNGYIATFAGQGDPAYSGDFGPAAAGKLNNPVSVVIDTEGTVYIADTYNNAVRAVYPKLVTPTPSSLPALAPTGNYRVMN